MARIAANILTGLLTVAGCWAAAEEVGASKIERDFQEPPREVRPETWFHLIGGNVDREYLTTDLEAVKGAGFRGFHLFHGAGRAWQGVTPQIQTLSPQWDRLIGHAADEAARLDLKFTMQNCPGWAMSGGPWIEPEDAMRHLIWSRTDLQGGQELAIQLPKPMPHEEEWRDYRDVAVLAFPTPSDDSAVPLQPASVASSLAASWQDLLAGKEDATIEIPSTPESPAWLEVVFENETLLRSIELPPTEHLMKRRSFDPDTTIRLQGLGPKGWVDIGSRVIPRGNWQDRLPEFGISLAYPDFPSTRFRIVFENSHPIELTSLRLGNGARLNDWRGQAGYVLRSLERTEPPAQAPTSFVPADRVLDLSNKIDAEGALHWDAPDGSWTVLRYGHVNTGAKNKPAPPEATGFECNKLSKRGAEKHFAGYIGRLCGSGGPADQGRLQGMLIDSWECYTQTWTEEMEEEFKQRRGYALRTMLPALSGWVVDDIPTSERFLRDWRDTINDLLVENYFGRMAELGREQGLTLSFETAIGDVSPGDILQFSSKADIPMCEAWTPNDPHWGGFETKPTAPMVSSAHIYGKPLIAAESFTRAGSNGHTTWDEHFYTIKHLANLHFAQGINHVVFHTFTHNPFDRTPGTTFGSTIGTPFIRNQTWWKHMPAFTDYISRCQVLLQSGLPVSDVLWYLGDDLDHKPVQHSPFPDGYKFDYLNHDVLMNGLQVADGSLHIDNGTEWQVIWLAQEQCRRMKPETLARLKDLLEAGATVIGPAPQLNASLSGGAEADRAFQRLVEELWGKSPAETGDRAIGKGRLLWGEKLSVFLNRLQLQPDVIGVKGATWCHRRIADKEIYFIAASRFGPLEANLQFRAKGKPFLWNPTTGTKSALPVFSRTGTHTVIPLSIPAADAAFITFEGTSPPASVVKIQRNGETIIDASDLQRTDQSAPFPIFGLKPSDSQQPWIEPQPLPPLDPVRMVSWQNGSYELIRADGAVTAMETMRASSLPLDRNWKLTFPDGWTNRKELSLDSARPWSELEDPETRSFSGTASYETILTLEQKHPDNRYLLDLGRVDSMAEIVVNGTSAAVVWAPPFRADLTTHLRAGENRIEIKVTNTWFNRLLYDAAQKPAKRKTWVIGGPKKNEAPVPAGLTGPVVLHVGEAVGAGISSDN